MNHPTSWILIFSIGFFAIGAIVGSFLNLCVARLPWEQSVLWPSSRCDACGAEVPRRALAPIVGWIAARGRATCCGARLAARYPWIEALTGLLFVLVYLIDTAHPPASDASAWTVWATVAAHMTLLAILVVISFIDIDLTIVPAPLTNLGIVLGLLFGLIAPGFRPEPAHATTPWGGLAVGLIGLAVGAGLVLFVRVSAHLVFRREAMGMGDVHILGVIGAYMGWQVAVLSFFLSSFYGLLPSLVKWLPFLWKRMTGREWRESDREIPLGPFLALAAGTFLLGWPWLWPTLIRPRFLLMESLVRFLVFGEPEI